MWSLAPYYGGVKATNGTLPGHPSLAQGNFAMTTTTFCIAFLNGAALGLRFSVWILIPFTGVAIVGTAWVESSHGDSIAALILAVGLMVAILQIGYFVGLLMHGVIASLIARRQKTDGAEELGLP
jgi:hypothetical protein